MLGKASKINTTSENKFNSYDITSFVLDMQRKYSSIFDGSLNLQEKGSDGEYYLRTDKAIFDFFYESLIAYHKTNSSVKDIFHPKKMYALHYWIIGEIHKRLKTLGKTRSCIIFVDNNGDFHVSNSTLYCFIGVLVDRLTAAGISNISKVGFPSYCKEFSLKTFGSKFTTAINKVLKTDRLRTGILKYSSPVNLILNQEMAIKNAKKMTVKEVYALSKAYNSNYLNIFKDDESFELAVKKLYSQCKVEMMSKRARQMSYNFKDLEQQLKKERISIKSCRNYLKYLALAATIQKRVGRPIELTASVEKKWFRNGYKILSKACQSLKWLNCTDSTFCKGVRSRSYAIRVCFNKDWKFKKESMTLNNIERYFYLIRDNDIKKSVCMEFGLAANYLVARCQLYDNIEKSKKLGKESYYAFTNVLLSNKERFAKLDRSRHNKSVVRAQIEHFKKTYGSVKQYKNNDGVKYFELDA